MSLTLKICFYFSVERVQIATSPLLDSRGDINPRSFAIQKRGQ